MNVITDILTQEKLNLKTTKSFCLSQRQVRVKNLRSPFFYVGDKFKILDQILPYFPDNIETFIEPFVGGGSVFLNVYAENYVLNDIDSYLVKLHKFLVTQSYNETDFFNKLVEIIDNYALSKSYLKDIVPDELKKEFKKTYYARFNKNGYLNLRNHFNKNKDDLFSLYILLIYGFNRTLRFNSFGDFNLPVGNVDFNKNVFNALINYFNCVRENDVEFFNMDFQDFIVKAKPTSKDFIYLDPPYLITFSEYNKLWNEDSEIRLIKLLDELDAKNIKFAVSNILWHRKKYNGTFNEWAQKYNIIRIKSNYISYHDNTEKDSFEVLVKNY